MDRPTGLGDGHDHNTYKAELALRVIQGRWKLLILGELLGGLRRFSDHQRALGGVSQKVLSSQLRHLESDGVVTRRLHAAVPPRVDYGLTGLGGERISAPVGD